MISFLFVFLLFVGFYIVFASDSYLKKLLGLSIFQTSVLIFFISIGKNMKGVAPVINTLEDKIYSSPLTSVLMLTAIVVGVATMSLGIALLIKIKESFGSISAKEIEQFRKL
jgi:multicomponent Na+:H+ antiporter subunit C